MVDDGGHWTVTMQLRTCTTRLLNSIVFHFVPIYDDPIRRTSAYYCAIEEIACLTNIHRERSSIYNSFAKKDEPPQSHVSNIAIHI